MTTLLVWLGAALAAYGFLLVFAWLGADRLMFQPPLSSYRDGPRILKIAGDDGTALSAIHVMAPDARYTMLYLHGNAEDLGHLLPQAEALGAHGFSVLAFDYRGYGTTPGEPKEANVLADTRAVFRHLRDQLGITPGRLIVYGRSLGSGPAVDLACTEPVAGLVLEGAFVSAFRVVTQVPMVPWDRFPNLARIPRVRCPVLVIHATRDETVPCLHGRRLLAAAPEPKRALWVQGAGHNDLVDVAGAGYWTALTDFAASLER